MARLLRAKNDLQEVVVSAAYQEKKQGFAQHRRSDAQECDSECELTDNIGEEMKVIILDEAGFWKDLIQILRVTYPIVCFLRLLDGNKPCLGKVSYKMSLVLDTVEKMEDKVPWAKEVKHLVMSRWEYMHSDMHAFAYVVNPEYADHVDNLDEYCQEDHFVTCVAWLFVTPSWRTT